MTPLLPLGLALAPGLPAQDLETVRVEHDDTRITSSCRIEVPAAPIADANGNGVILVVGNGITVELAGRLFGAPEEAPPNTLRGTGIHVIGRDVTLRGARVSGFRCGIRATNAGGLVLEDCDVSDNFRQELRSTPEAEDVADWLSPHDNDGDEWLERYGAGIWVESSTGATIRRCRARRVQNGLVLDGVEEARVYDNDFSFLSGWGIALWRSNRCTITRNALDFCIRGYSHGVYNRGQDSAGLLMFEQCSNNVIAENSATHGGDGLFGFAGKEALGQAPPPSEGFSYERRGNNENLIVENDFSYAAAHGIEMTFSFDNRIEGNRLVGNAICGIWGGYSQNSLIRDNLFEENGDAGYGEERGGINIEHGAANIVRGNRFRANACGIHLWWDEDEGLMSTPWARANETACVANLIVENSFEGDRVALHLRDCDATLTFGNEMKDVEVEVDATEGAEPAEGSPLPDWAPPALEILGETRPVGARAALGGREAIVMTRWGPKELE